MRCAAARALELTCAALVLLASGAPFHRAEAQARIERIDLERFPSVTLHVRFLHPSGGRIPDIRNVRVTENGIAQGIEYFACPEDSIRLSIVILLDRSASMAQAGDRPDPESTKLREAKVAINAFLDLLGDRDEAALCTFATEDFTLRHIFTVAQDFTFDESKLRAALVPVAAGGGTRIWQAVIDAVRLVEGRAGRRVIVLVTDGRNRLGETYRMPAVQAAKQAGIPVFAVGIGPDADIAALAGLAEATGGEFHFAPEAGDLIDVFRELGGRLLTDACVLRYVSGNPCFDGSRRDVEVEISAPGLQTQADSFYTVPSRLGTATLRPAFSGNAVARDSLVVSVLMPEHISTKEMLSYEMTIHYDRHLMRFMRVGTAGTMSDGAEVLASEGVPGDLQVSCVSMHPFIPSGSLFDIHFFCFPSDSMAWAEITITDAGMAGRCPTIVSTESAMLDILPCEDRFLLGDSLGVTLPHDGTEGLLPLMLRGTLPEGANAHIVLRLSTEGLPFEILGVETAGSMCAGGGVLVQEVSPGQLEFTALAAGSDDALLFSLRIRAREAGRQPTIVAVPLLPVDIVTGCQVTVEDASSRRWGTVVIDGICEPVLRLRRSPSLGNHPNPFFDATSIRFSLPVDGRAALRVMDTNGRIVATVLDAPMRAGEYVFRFDGERLPAGEYYALLEHSGGVQVRRMMLLR